MPDIQSIEGHLRDMPKGEKFRKLARMRELRTVMVFSVRDAQRGHLALRLGPCHMLKYLTLRSPRMSVRCIRVSTGACCRVVPR